MMTAVTSNQNAKLLTVLVMKYSMKSIQMAQKHLSSEMDINNGNDLPQTCYRHLLNLGTLTTKIHFKYL